MLEMVDVVSRDLVYNPPHVQRSIFGVRELTLALFRCQAPEQRRVHLAQRHVRVQRRARVEGVFQGQPVVL